MKKHLLSLALLAVLASGASAASAQSNVLQLPTYVVNAPRTSAAEQSVNASLQVLREQAAAPVALPELSRQSDDSQMVARIARDSQAPRLAKS